MKWSLFQEKVMNIKCDVIVDAWLGQIVDTGCEVGIFLSTQTSSCILSKYSCQIQSAYCGVEGCVTNEDIIGVSVIHFFIQSSQDAFEDLP